MRTAWGYEVSDELAPIIDVDDFNDITNGSFADNPRAESALKAASQAVRNYCGWHISPSLQCTAYPVGGSVLAKLPAGYVSGIKSITENGTELSSDEFEWRHDGLLKRCCGWTDKWGGIKAVYIAGYDASAVPDIVEAVCAIASGVLSVSAGIVQESADGVSIMYSTNASSIAAALTSAQKDALASYKVISSHAA